MGRKRLAPLLIVAGCSAGTAQLQSGQAPDETFLLECTVGRPQKCVERVATTTTTMPPVNETAWLDEHFLIGVDLQPVSLVDDWAARGVNTLMRIDHNHASTDAQIDAWDAAAAANGLRTIRQPKANPADDIGNATLLAWAPHKDEPDLTSGQVAPEDVQAEYAALKAVHAERPITLTVTGDMFQHDVDEPTLHSEPWMSEYFEGADWLAADIYPANRGKIAQLVPLLGTMMTKLHTWQEPERVKPAIAYIEASDYDTTANRPAPGPTPAQTEAEVWYVITEGARGVIYFPERVAPDFTHDATTSAMQAKLTTLNGHLSELETVLQGPIDPAGASVSAASPLEVGWRLTATDAYVIVVNPTGTAVNGVQVTVTGTLDATEVLWEGRSETQTGNKITDDFAAYSVHVYRAPRG